ncbi:hypothetical protein AMS68_001678 [Peltaster fructicola]|uniref:Uncharacterized protein n=1 Tax=Peltaster fructicola TaxID=286661 RepID=A0A6H0XND2_9PEZI|nr:hypothetical protein AMS68_001678 [Peltaster fructicola]
MASSATNALDTADGGRAPAKSAVLHRSLHEMPLMIERAEGNFIYLSEGRKILDATGGAAVACLGHGNRRLAEAMMEQVLAIEYCHSLYFACRPVEELAQVMIDSTNGDMARAFFVSSGSEAMEAALKFARQYHLEKQPEESSRVHFICRRQSYHGSTLGALGSGGHAARRQLFEPILSTNTSLVSPCYAYRPPIAGMSTHEHVRYLEDELEEEFQRIGPHNVAGFIAEPVVGAALGCVAPLPGYFAAVRRVCDRHGALLIFDEVMSGCGRVGPVPTEAYPSPLHAYQDPLVGVAPDVLIMGKGLGAGYQPLAAMLLSKPVVQTLMQGSGSFGHGQTFQGHPVGCRAGLEVQRIIQQDELVSNVRKQGTLLAKALHSRLDGHPNVGDIRGMGLFWGIEFVKDKATKQPFDVSKTVAWRIHQLGLQAPYNICLYPGGGTVDGVHGDHVLLAPAYTCSSRDIEDIVKRTGDVIETFFQGEEKQMRSA